MGALRKQQQMQERLAKEGAAAQKTSGFDEAWLSSYMARFASAGKPAPVPSPVKGARPEEKVRQVMRTRKPDLVIDPAFRRETDEHGPALVVRLPIRTYGEKNRCEHFRVKAERTKAQREMTRLILKSHQVPKLSPPGIVCELVRIAPRMLDARGNLEGSLSAVRDEIADWLGLPDDRDQTACDFPCSQRSEGPRTYGVEVVIRFGGAPKGGES